MGLTTFDRVFGVRALNGNLVRAFEQQAFNRQLQTLFRQNGRQLLTTETGDQVEWDQVDMPKTPAPFVGRSSPAAEQKGLQKQTNRATALPTILLRSFLPESELFSKRFPGSLVPNAQERIAIEQEALAIRIGLTLELFAAKMLDGGKFDADADVPENQAPFVIDQSGDIQTRNAGSPWTTKTTSIFSDELPKTIDKFFQGARMKPGLVITEEEVLRSIRGNTELKNVLFPVRNDGMLQALQSAGSIVGQLTEAFELDGLTYRINRGGYDDANGTFQPYISAGKAIFLPAPQDLSPTLVWAEGRGVVPSAAIGTDSLTVMSQPGMWSYAVPETDPVGINLFMGWRGLFALGFPKGVLQLDTSP